jgi:hypothetical protein
MVDEAERIRVALRDITPKQVVVAKRLSAWRALTAILYLAHAVPKRGRAKVAEAGSIDAPQHAAGLAYRWLRQRHKQLDD